VVDAARRSAADVRLWVDRSFTIRGAGTVVTGTHAADGNRTASDSVGRSAILKTEPVTRPDTPP
jgi:selenocysteine-specific translation elongation factor